MLPMRTYKMDKHSVPSTCREKGTKRDMVRAYPSQFLHAALLFANQTHRRYHSVTDPLDNECIHSSGFIVYKTHRGDIFGVNVLSTSAGIPSKASPVRFARSVNVYDT